MSDNDTDRRFDEVVAEIRRLGRGVVAAQAAAESNLASVRELAGRLARTEAPAPTPPDHPWVETLLPLFDAIDRVEDQAARLAGAVGAGWWGRLFPGLASRPDLESLAEALRVLRSLRDQALARLDVEMDGRPGMPVDPNRHRVVGTRPPGPGEPAGGILEVVRPGYRYAGRLVREADVVAAAPAAPRGNGGRP